MCGKCFLCLVYLSPCSTVHRDSVTPCLWGFMCSLCFLTVCVNADLLFSCLFSVSGSFKMLTQQNIFFYIGISLFIYAENIFWLPFVSSHFLPSSSPPFLLFALQLKKKTYCEFHYSTIGTDAGCSWGQHVVFISLSDLYSCPSPALEPGPLYRDISEHLSH